MGKRGIICFYRKLLKEGKILIGGSAHKRLKQLESEYRSTSKGYTEI